MGCRSQSRTLGSGWALGLLCKSRAFHLPWCPVVTTSHFYQSLLPVGELPEGNVCLYYCFILGASEADPETKGQCTKKGDRIAFQAHSVLDSWAQSPADSESQERAAPCEGGELLAAPRGVNSPVFRASCAWVEQTFAASKKALRQIRSCWQLEGCLAGSEVGDRG